MSPLFIKQMRKSLMLSQSQLAKSLNVSLSSVKSWEQSPDSIGYRPPTGATLGALRLLLAGLCITNRSRLKLPIDKTSSADELGVWEALSIAESISNGTVTLNDALNGISYYQQRILCIYHVYIANNVLFIQNRDYGELGSDETPGATRIELAEGQTISFEYVFDDKCPPWNTADDRSMYRQNIQSILELKLPYNDLTVGDILRQADTRSKVKYLD